MNEVRLNLARKWRSKNFDQIIGQDLTIRILKNSLYLGNYFPVYLFLGQRGSGKTSTARVFAAAINCHNLTQFRSEPQKNIIPCGTCESCTAMLSGKHPDFIEMDAASHTGVDNVRNIIDAASLMPILGHKKIYLIDEAHMLSKAAFNAFLKILEEPPESALFILATTDPEKIIETVKSRCFQLFFKPVASTPLESHLTQICKKETIEYEPEAIKIIVKESEGSVRDALNLLEQTRFATGSVTKEGIIKTLGHLDESSLCKLIEALLCKKSPDVLPLVEKLNIRLYSADHIWLHLVSLIRAAIWLKHDITPQTHTENHIFLVKLNKKVSLCTLMSLLERFYEKELLFSKTTDKHLFLEILFLQACQSNDMPPTSNLTPANPPLPPSSPVSDQEETVEYIIEEEEVEEEIDDDEDDANQEECCAKKIWESFLGKIDSLDDPLISSVFKQGTDAQFNNNKEKISISFPKQFSFFEEWISSNKSIWEPLFKKICGKNVSLTPLFTLEKKIEMQALVKTARSNNKTTAQEQPANNISATKKPQQLYPSQGKYTMRSNTKNTSRVDISDVQQWQKANLLLRYFPGVVSESL